MDFIKNNVSIDENSCWNWNKSITSAGYGQFTSNKKYWTTHRYAYTKTYGEIPDGLIIRHLCHNTKCCSPEHLTIGTNRDNWWDSEIIHREVLGRLAKGVVINDTHYRTLRDAKEATGLSMNSLVNLTDPINRIFDVDKYRERCLKSHRWCPKV